MYLELLTFRFVDLLTNTFNGYFDFTITKHNHSVIYLV